MSIRAEVVSLLSITDLGTVLEGASRADWKHHDGTSLTVTEQDLVASATRAELVAGRDFAVLAVDYHAEKVAILDRIVDICEPYFLRLGTGTVMEDIWPLMTGDERAEVTGLLERVEGAFS